MESQRGQALTGEHVGQGRPGGGVAHPGQEPGRHLGFEERCRPQEATVLLGHQGQIQQRRPPPTGRLVDGHLQYPVLAERRPEIGVVP